MKIPLGYKTKSERRHYEKRSRKLERFMNKSLKILQEYLNLRNKGG